MRAFAKRAAALALVYAAAALPARADMSTADIQAKVDNAMRSAKSFVIITQYPPQSYSSTLVFVAPNRYRVAVAIAATTTDVITIGDTSYSSKNGAPFESAAVAPDESARMKQIGQVKVGSTHPDITVDGVTYGAFVATPAPEGDTTLTCTYDKQTYRLARCTNGDWTQTFSGYDDPKNVIDPPGAQK